MKAKTVETKVAQSEARALSKFNLISHIKMNAVCREIRNLDYTTAINLLGQLPNKSARIIEKTIKSAYNNLLQVDSNVTEENCYVKTLEVGTGPNIKRMVPRARGRADIQFKRTSHLTAVVARRS